MKHADEKEDRVACAVDDKMILLRNNDKTGTLLGPTNVHYYTEPGTLLM